MSDWRDTYEYRVWRATVIMRDKRCVICNSLKGREAHHVNHATYYPELRFDPDNGVTLCSACHMNYHCNFNRSYRTLCDEYNFMNFVKLARYFNETWADLYIIPDNYEIGPLGYEGLEPAVVDAVWKRAAYERSPDSVVGYVTELASLRYPA